MKTKMNNYNNVVIVTDAKWRKSLSAIRALGKNNNYIVAIGNSIFDMGLWSKYVNKKVIAKPLNKNGEEDFKKKLTKIINKCGKVNSKKPILIAMEDETLNWLIYNKNALTNCKTLLPDFNSFTIANNKLKITRFAESLGIDTPDTKEFGDCNRLIDFLNKNKNDNWVVKPQISKGSFGLTYISEETDLDIIKKNWNKYGKLILQDRIPLEGESICVSMIFSKSHKMVANFVHKRIHTYPLNGGPSTYRVSISNSDIVEQSYHLLRKLNWVGVAMVEWKKDTRDDKYKLIEINPRFWGGLELAIKCGIDFPQLYVDLCENKTITPSKEYPVGIVSRWVIPGEILRLISTITKCRKPDKGFFFHIFRDSDEWDKTDLSGSVATVLCQFVQALNPHNWRFLKR